MNPDEQFDETLYIVYLVIALFMSVCALAYIAGVIIGWGLTKLLWI